ncbi:protein FAR-RED IMPAIRED RESPONSE 1-like [Bidens hawaiensis]|uniref:protein FAR-RED IMPAIRED RESPONSE 1-like n=1 Tax=Bidens hawaiensis TaxID=980011 RepID=UPI004048F625
MVFESVDHAYDFYCEYAKKAGFCVRKGDRIIKEGKDQQFGVVVELKFFKFDDGLRKLTHVQQDIIYEMSTLNLGPVKAFNILRTKYGGFEEVGSTKDDYSLFWADEISKKNYLAFGDIISFDATFKTNKYTMVFVPFTVIDNHCRNITVVFLDSFGIAPKVVVTDQDPAMKQAISFVLPNSSHRLFMWHIMKKLSDKVGVALCNNEDFKRKICDIVWTDAISQSEFDTQWELIMKEYDPETNKWLSDMFEMRYDWIPADYMDELLSGLMRNYIKIRKFKGAMVGKIIKIQGTRIQIQSGVACVKSTEEEDIVRFSVFYFNAYVPGCLEVLFKKDREDGIDSTISCACKRFEHYGVTGFPKKYMVDRWKRDACVNPRTAPISSFSNDKNLKVKEISWEITLAGYDQPSEVTARVPSGIKNKDRGSHKKIKSQKEL